MRIYIIASFSRREECRTYAADLRALGHLITSEWLDHEDSGDNGVAWQATEQQRMQAAVTDLMGIRAADTVIVFTEPEGSIYQRGNRLVELGIALGDRHRNDKRIILVGPPEEQIIFTAIPWLGTFETWEECLRMFRALAEMAA